MIHLDEDGKPCTRHATSEDVLMTYAVIGARVASFNHDIASKLQGLMMSIDEIDEICERVADGDLRRATDTAQAAMKEANTMLSANRALTRTSTRAKVQLCDLVEQASKRAGVAMRGAVPDGQVELVVALTVHALGLALDAIGGVGRGRAVELSATIDGGRAHLVFTGAPATSGDAFALAAFAIARAGGELRCRPDGLAVQLPLS